MSGKNWVGICLLLLGVGFLLQQADLFNFSSALSVWWPLILILIGIIQLTNRSHSSGVSGWLFLLIGGLFLADQWTDANLLIYLWPLILIFIGLTFIFSRGYQRKKPADSKNAIQTLLFFSGTEVRNRSKSFEGGSVTAVFGGAEIDLREAVMSDKGAALDLTTVFGGINIYVAEGVQVEVSGLPIFGGCNDKTRKMGENYTSVLKVNALTVFGGVEISHEPR
jgi:predicted membrane protein